MVLLVQRRSGSGMIGRSITCCECRRTLLAADATCLIRGRSGYKIARRIHVEGRPLLKGREVDHPWHRGQEGSCPSVSGQALHLWIEVALDGDWMGGLVTHAELGSDGTPGDRTKELGGGMNRHQGHVA